MGTLSPWSRDGTPARGITITDRAGGSCFGTAESTMRRDDWRCTAGDRILDPCFFPDSNPEDTGALCFDGAPTRMDMIADKTDCCPPVQEQWAPNTVATTVICGVPWPRRNRGKVGT